jgi:hypothetical protein
MQHSASYQFKVLNVAQNCKLLNYSVVIGSTSSMHAVFLPRQICSCWTKPKRIVPLGLPFFASWQRRLLPQTPLGATLRNSQRIGHSANSNSANPSK